MEKTTYSRITEKELSEFEKFREIVRRRYASARPFGMPEDEQIAESFNSVKP